MAEFDKGGVGNPAVLDQTGASRGFSVGGRVSGPSAIETAAGVAGQALTMGVGIADTYVKGNIQREAHQNVDAVMSQFGVDSAVITEAGAYLPDNVRPEEIDQAYQRLNMMDRAVKSGKMRESSYWAQLDLVSRQLRYRYPGYREEIDATMSKLTGSVPANALRRSLMSEMSTETTDKSEKYKQELINQAVKEGIPGVFEKYQASLARGVEPTLDDVRGWWQNSTAIKYSQDAEKRALELRGANRQDVQERGVVAAGNAVFTRLGAIIDGTVSSIAPNLEQLSIKMEQFKNNPNNPELVQQMTVLATTLRNEKEKIKAQIRAEYAFLPADKLNQQLSQIDGWLEGFIGAVNDKDTGMVNYYASQVKLMQDASTYDILKNQPNAGIAGSMSTVLGPELTKIVLGSNIKGISALQKNMSDYLLLKLAEDGSSETVIKGANKMSENGAFDEKTADALLKNIQSAITSDVLPSGSNAAENLIRKLYGGVGRTENVMSLIPPSQRIEKFLGLQNPKFVKDLRTKLDTGEISPAAWEVYNNWVVDTATRLLKVEAAEAQNIVTNRRGLDLTFDDKTGLLKVTPRAFNRESTGGREFAVSAAENVLEKSAEEKVRTINKVLMALKPLVEANGENVSSTIPLFLENITINLKQKKGESDVQSVFSAIDKAISDRKEAEIDKKGRTKDQGRIN